MTRFTANIRDSWHGFDFCSTSFIAVVMLM